MAAGPFIDNPRNGLSLDAAINRANGAEACAQRQRDLPGGLERLEREYTALAEVLAELEKRLTPVCAPSKPTASERLVAGTVDPVSEYGARLHGIAGQIGRTTQGVHELMYRLEV